MQYEDLPRDWAQRPVDDPEVFEGVVDLVVTPVVRERGALVVLLCHPDGRLFQVRFLDERLPDGAAREVERLADLLCECAVTDLVLVLARPGPAGLGARDLHRQEALTRACLRRGVRLRGVAVAGTDRVLKLLPLGYHRVA